MVILRLVSILLFFALVSCSKSDETDVDPAPISQAQQVRQRLITPSKWLVDEAREQNTVYFKRGVQQVGEADMPIEWIRFLADGRFEAKLLDESAPIILFYKLSETTSELLLSETSTFTTKLAGRTSFSDISQQQTVISINEGPNDQITLTLVAQP